MLLAPIRREPSFSAENGSTLLQVSGINLHNYKQAEPPSPYGWRRRGEFMNTSGFFLAMSSPCLLFCGWLLAGPLMAANPPVKPLDQLGATAAKQYSGDGLLAAGIHDSVQLNCACQKMDGEASRQGLWLISTVSNKVSERFRVMATEVGRVAPWTPTTPTLG